MASGIGPLTKLLKAMLDRASREAMKQPSSMGAHILGGLSAIDQLLGGRGFVEMQMEGRNLLQEEYDISEADADSIAGTAIALLQGDGDDLLLPRSRETGELKPIQYLVFDLVAGRAWGLAPGGYNSRKRVLSSRRRGFSFGIRAGRRRTSLTNRLARGR